jgi:hypothetical protein
VEELAVLAGSAPHDGPPHGNVGDRGGAPEELLDGCKDSGVVRHPHEQWQFDDILPPRPEVNPRIYAYAIDTPSHAGLLKIGQTTRDVKQRVAEQVKTAAIKNYRIELDESAERHDGTIFTDNDVRAALAKKGLKKADLEWMCCSIKDVKTALTELRTGQRFTGSHHETFVMRREQADAYGYGDGERYDALLEGYEPGMRVKRLTPVLSQLKEKLVPGKPSSTSRTRPICWRISGVMPGAGASSSTFWWRRWTEQSRSNR